MARPLSLVVVALTLMGARGSQAEDCRACLKKEGMAWCPGPPGGAAWCLQADAYDCEGGFVEKAKACPAEGEEDKVQVRDSRPRGRGGRDPRPPPFPP